LIGKQNNFVKMEKESENLNNDKNLESQLTDDTEELEDEQVVEEEEQEKVEIDLASKFCSCRVCENERKNFNIIRARKKQKIDNDLSENVTQ